MAHLYLSTHSPSAYPPINKSTPIQRYNYNHHMSDPSKSPIHRNGTRASPKSSKQPKKHRPKNKSMAYEVIDLEQDNTERRPYDPSDLFIGALARKCSNFFDWLSNSHSDSLAELLWKNEMIIYASELYPELNNNELARLVDRDWKYMPEAERNKICEVYSRLPAEGELEEKMAKSDPQLYF